MISLMDTAYIRSEYRNRGFDMEILFDAIMHFPNKDIGFSKSISNGMLISKYSTHKYRRIMIRIIIIHISLSTILKTLLIKHKEY